MLLTLDALIRILTKLGQVAYFGHLFLHIIYATLRHLLSVQKVTARDYSGWSTIPEINHTLIAIFVI